ncbi:putative transporter small subunit [Advenella mimigardefordensis]|nr:putative transporter small subunit [Advenella mimigardefordensis]
MNELLLTAYILVWPVISAVILSVLIVALIRDLRAAKKSDGEMI